MKNQKPKLVRELYDEFMEKFTTRDIAENTSLQVLFEYLQAQYKRNNGCFIHVPSNYICDLIQKHLNYDIREFDRIYEKQSAK